MHQQQVGNGHPVPAADQSRAFVREQFVVLFLSLNTRAQAGLLISALLIAFLVGSHPGQGLPAAVWFALVCVAGLLRMAFTHRFVLAGGLGQALPRIAVVFACHSVLLSLPLAGFLNMAETERAAYAIILMATATASVATTAGYGLVFLAYAAPMLLALAVAWAGVSVGKDAAIAGVGLGVLIVLFLLFLIGLARQVGQVFDESCRIRWAEQGLNAELKQALEDADHANRVKTQFLAAASHDLRQPIHSINVLIAALGKRRLDERSAEIAHLLSTVNQTLQSQLDGLLDISRLDAGTVKPQWQPCRLDRLLVDHHAALAAVAAQRGLACRLEGGGGREGEGTEPVVRTDPGLLLRVLGNLCDNALKFTPPGGALTLGWRRVGGQVECWVADTGIGIPAGEQAQVFREFYQVGNAERDRTKGLGLGLSIVQRLCALLGVELKLESVPGQGTTVRLRLPQDTAGLPALQVTAAAPPQLPTGLVVMVVDDEERVRHSMRLFLDELGCRVLLADGVAQAQTLAIEQPVVDAVLSDLRLRDGDTGIDALLAVRARHPAARLAILTGDTDPARVAMAQASGFPVLHKPAPEAMLIAVLAPRSL